MAKTTMPSILRVGDRMRMTVALLKEIHGQPDHQTHVMVVSRIQESDDGTKDIHVEVQD